MAMTHERAMEVANLAKGYADKLLEVRAMGELLVAANNAMAIDWGAQEAPAFLNITAPQNNDSNLDGSLYNRHQVANLIGTAYQVQLLLENGQPSQGDHLGNVLAIASVKV